MKKIIALVAAAVLSASAVFAENTLHLGMGIPISPLTDEDSESVSHVAFDFAFDYTHVADSGFTFKVGFDVGVAKSNDLVNFDGDDAKGLDLAFGIGLGGSPIHNEKMTLSILGDFGFRYSGFDLGDVDLYVAKISDFGVSEFLFYVGPEAAFTFRFNDHIGLFANFGIFYNIGAAGFSYSFSGDSSYDIYDDETWTISGFTFQPKFGLAITF